MTFFKKIKQLIAPTQQDSTANTDQVSQTSQDASADDIAELKNALLSHAPEQLPDYLCPITNTIKDWLTAQQWNFSIHNPHPEDSFRTHHITLTFGEKDYDWNCVYRISEKNQLVTIYGVLLVNPPKTHYLNLLWHLSEINNSTSFGNIELDISTGDIRAKIAFDAEFTHINDRTLSIYMQGVAGLVELAFEFYQRAINEPAIGSLDALFAQKLNQSTDDDVFFAPTLAMQ